LPTERTSTMYTPGHALPEHERRRFPRYFVNARLTLAIEDESLQESIGVGEPGDISLGGIRVCNLPACPNVRIGDKLGLLLMDHENALSLRGEVVHHATPDTFGVEFRSISPADQLAVSGIIARLYN
jgi:PilZ domain-containing protein